MPHARLYIIQLFGLLLLACSYFLSDPPDSLSVMHFNPVSSCRSSISKSTQSGETGGKQTIAQSSGQRHDQKCVSTFWSFDIIIPHTGVALPQPKAMCVHKYVLMPSYAYLFFAEINPPPPKAC